MDNTPHNIDEIFARTLGDHRIDPPASVWDKIQGQLDAASSSQDIDKVFEQTLNQHTMTPPAYVWDNIKGKLDAADGKRRARIGWIFGSASAVIFSFVGGYFIANYSGNANETHASEKISNQHQVQIDVNHFWDLRGVTTYGETTSGGQTFTNTTPNNVNNGNEGTNYDDGNDHRTAPNSASGEVITPLVPSQNQEKGRDDEGKKTDAVTSDVIGKVESQIGTKGSTNVTANDNNNQVVIDNNSTNQSVFTNTNNSNNKVEESHVEKVNPNDESTLENGNPLKLKEDVITTFTILPYFAPTYTARNSSIDNTNGYQNAFGTDPNFKENASFAYSTGVLVGYNFTPRLTIFIGASFNTFSNTTNRDYIHSKSFDQITPGDTSTYAISTAGEMNGLNIVPTQGTPENPTYIQQDYLMNPSQIGSIKKVTQTFSYVEVPVMARYKLFGPKVGLTLTGGLSTGFIVQNDVLVSTDTETKRFGETSQIRNFNMNAIIGVGIEAKLTPFMYLNIEPTFKYSFLNWSMDPRFKVNPISIGLTTGLAFKF
jgi:hypothetical protein